MSVERRFGQSSRLCWVKPVRFLNLLNTRSTTARFLARVREILRKQLDGDIAYSIIEREKMLEKISNISRIVEEIRNLLKDEKGK